MNLVSTGLTKLADASSAASVMNAFVAPVIQTLCVLASLVCVAFIINGAYHYMTSSGNPEKLEQAKRILKNALIGLVIVLAAGVLSAMLAHAYSGTNNGLGQNLPSLTSVTPTPVSNGLVDVLIKAITGLLNNIIQNIASPFLKALSYFTSQTPLMAANSSVFNLWLVMVGIGDALFVLVIALLGFHVMSASTFGFDEIEIRHLLPQLALVFLLVNTSIFGIDAVIELSNVLIKAVNASGASSVWTSLTNVVSQSGSLSVAGLLIMITLLIFSFILLIYYIGRIVTLYLGAVLSPLILLLWLIPSFKDFASTAIKVYLTTIFVLFVNVVILELAASLFSAINDAGSVIPSSSDLISLLLGVATIIALLKTQGVMMQFTYAGIGPKSIRKLGSQFISAVSYTNGRWLASGSQLADKATGEQASSQGKKSMPIAAVGVVNTSSKKKNTNNVNSNKVNTSSTNTKNTTKPKAMEPLKTGTTDVAPKVAKARLPDPEPFSKSDLEKKNRSSKL